MNSLMESVAVALAVEAPTLETASRFREHPNWDSLASILLIAEIDERFGVILSREDLDRLDTIDDLKTFVLNNSDSVDGDSQV